MKQRTARAAARKHPPLCVVPRRWVLGLSAALTVIGLAAVCVLVMFSLRPGASMPAGTANKLSQIDTANAAGGTHAPKSLGTATRAASCPRSAVQTGIVTGDNGGFHANIVNEAVIAPVSGRPFEYIVFAGSATADAPQGLLIVVRLDADPCAASASGTQVQYFATPGTPGFVHLTAILGDIVTYADARGKIGHFDYVSGAFSA